MDKDRKKAGNAFTAKESSFAKAMKDREWRMAKAGGAAAPPHRETTNIEGHGRQEFQGGEEDYDYD